MTKTCTADDCPRNCVAKDYCLMHYRRWKRNGDPNTLQRMPTVDKCIAVDCERIPIARQMCRLHWDRWRKHGDPSTVLNRFAEIGTTSVSSDGYTMQKTETGRWKQQHRIIMEDFLGRKLLPGENVHHKNGVRSDNRPENLELWVTSQPSGQRPEDLIEWAEEILRRYKKED